MKLNISKKNRILHLTLSRPEKRNALTLEMCEGIVGAIDSAQNDDHIGCVLIAAEGPVFCAGMDLEEAATPPLTKLTAVHERLFSIGQQSLKPIVVAVNGAALGGGLGLVAQGHLVVAEASSLFALPEIKVGLWPFLVYRALEAAIGPRRTLSISLAGGTFNADRALSWGLIGQICPDDEVRDRAEAVARDLAKACPAAIEAGMQYLRDSRGKTWEEAGQVAASLRDKLMASADFEEGCAAFKERREALWPSMPKEFYAERHKHRHNHVPVVKA